VAACGSAVGWGCAGGVAVGAAVGAASGTAGRAASGACGAVVARVRHLQCGVGGVWYSLKGCSRE
jgi:hypothetical protein